MIIINLIVKLNIKLAKKISLELKILQLNIYLKKYIYDIIDLIKLLKE